MSAPPQPPPGDHELVVYGDDQEIARWQRELAAHGLSASAGGSLASSNSPCATEAGWALVPARQLEELRVRATQARDLALASSPPLPTQAEFRATATTILSTSQPPNDRIAFVSVHLGLGAGAPSPEIELEVARRLRLCIRQRDSAAQNTVQDAQHCLARVATEDYCILLTGIDRPHLAFKVTERLRQKLSEPFQTPRGPLQAQVSIGIALHPEDGRDLDTLTERARAAQRTAAHEQLTAPCFYQPTMNTAVGQRVALEAALRDARQRNELSVVYQPKVQIDTCEIVGAEALMRWTSPEFGHVSPAQFIPIAEETGLILSLGEFVLEEACRQNAAFRAQGLPPIRMGVNLSTLQLHEASIFDLLTRILTKTGLPPTGLELELTESVLLQNVEACLNTMKRLKGHGIQLSIDDFGTGYSSLAYLKRFPIDSLKIDRAFIQDLTINPDDAAITTSIILMGKSLKLNVVAEGVETRSQLKLLHVLECDEAQGYLFGRPMGAGAFGGLLGKGIDKSLLPANP